MSMTKLIVCLALIITLPLLSGATIPRRQTLHTPDPLFFLTNNDDVMEALQAYAEMLCRQDSPGAMCGDSKRNADGDSLTHDGKWHDYVWLAYAGIVAMCKDAPGQELCKWFRG